MGTLQTGQSTVTIDSLSPCLSYWVVVTAMDSTCGTELNSSPQMIGLFESVEFKFAIDIEDASPCKMWIAENSARKLSDIQSSIGTGLRTSSCQLSTPCVANGQFTCEGDPEVITYQ